MISALLKWIGGIDIDQDISSIHLDSFSLPYTCVIFSLIAYPVLSMKDLSLFIKVGSFGIVFVCIILVFIFSYGFMALGNTTFTISNEPNDYTDPENRNISLAKSHIGSLAGTMCLGYYLHNCAIPIVRNASNPAKNGRDVFLGYSMVFICYIAAGILGYIGFGGATFVVDIKQNSLLMFESDDVLAFIIRTCSFLQMFTVFPILFHILREQSSTILFRHPDMPRKQSIIFNLVFLAMATCVGAFYPKVGDILGIVGAICGLAMMYIFPIITHLKRTYILITNPELGRAIDENRVEGMKSG